jgi:hypothetical protein
VQPESDDGCPPLSVPHEQGERGRVAGVELQLYPVASCSPLERPWPPWRPWVPQLQRRRRRQRAVPHRPWHRAPHAPRTPVRPLVHSLHLLLHCCHEWRCADPCPAEERPLLPRRQPTMPQRTEQRGHWAVSEQVYHQWLPAGVWVAA